MITSKVKKTMGKKGMTVRRLAEETGLALETIMLATARQARMVPNWSHLDS